MLYKSSLTALVFSKVIGDSEPDDLCMKTNGLIGSETKNFFLVMDFSIK